MYSLHIFNLPTVLSDGCFGSTPKASTEILDVIDQTPILRPYQPVTKISWILLERSVFLTYSREQYQILQCQV